MQLQKSPQRQQGKLQRQIRRSQRKSRNERNEEQEGPTYEPGAFGL